MARIPSFLVGLCDSVARPRGHLTVFRKNYSFFSVANRAIGKIFHHDVVVVFERNSFELARPDCKVLGDWALRL